MSHPFSHAHCQYDHNRQQMKLMHNFNHFDFRKHYLSTPSQSQTVKLSCVIARVKVPALHSVRPAVYSPLSNSCCQHSASVLCNLKSCYKPVWKFSLYIPPWERCLLKLAYVFIGRCKIALSLGHSYFHNFKCIKSNFSY